MILARARARRRVSSALGLSCVMMCSVSAARFAPLHNQLGSFEVRATRTELQFPIPASRCMGRWAMRLEPERQRVRLKKVETKARRVPRSRRFFGLRHMRCALSFSPIGFSPANNEHREREVFSGRDEASRRDFRLPSRVEHVHAHDDVMDATTVFRVGMVAPTIPNGRRS